METKVTMKWVVLLVAGLLLMIALVAAGCTPGAPPEQEEAVNSCTSCHTDKDLLKEVAVEPEVVTSEETTGEG
jgi:cytochrome c553